MKPRCEFAYAQARLRARLGRSPTPGLWNRLDPVDDPDRALRLAAAHGPWKDMLSGLTGHSDPHRMESALEARFVNEVDQVAGWGPPAWGQAVRRLADLPGLARVRHGSGGASPWRWLADRPGPQLALDRGWPAGGAELLDTWLTHWSRRAAAAGARAELEPLLQRIRRALAGAVPGTRFEELRKDLVRHCRSQAAQPWTAIAYLAVFALDLVRLRGLLLQTRLLPATGAAP